MLNGEFGERVGTLQIKFGADVSAMIVNRARADAEFSGYLFGCLQFGKQQEHALFGGGQIADASQLLSLNGAAAAS